MKKIIIAAAAIAVLAGAGLTFDAVAAPGAGDAANAPAHAMADSAFLMDARIAGMKAALKLSPEQEKAWPAFESAVRDAQKTRVEAMRAHHEEMAKEGRPTPVARLSEMADSLSKASEELTKVADAAKPLYDSLDETQKRHFGPLLMTLREGGPWGPHEGMHGEGMHGEGMHGEGMHGEGMHGERGADGAHEHGEPL